VDENIRPDVRLRPHLPVDAVKTAFARTWHGRPTSTRTHLRVRAGAGQRGPMTAHPRGRAWTRVARPRACANEVKRPHGPVAARTHGHGGAEKLEFPL
jgi:hypothetical protein